MKPQTQRRWFYASPHDAFNLLELLVTVAIITILAALLLPALATAKASGRSAACKSNLRQIGISMADFTHEEDRFPAAQHWDATVNPFVTYGWPARLLPGLGSNTSVFRCPATDSRFDWPAKPSPLGYAFPFNVDPGTSRFSYGYNVSGVASMGGHGLGSGPPPGIPVSRVTHPAEMIAIADSDGSGLWDGEITFNRVALPGGPRVLFPPGSRHKLGANVVFCDGHVEWARQSKWIEGTDEAARRWNNDHQTHRPLWVTSSGF